MKMKPYQGNYKRERGRGRETIIKKKDRKTLLYTSERELTNTLAAEHLYVVHDFLIA